MVRILDSGGIAGELTVGRANTIQLIKVGSPSVPDLRISRHCRAVSRFHGRTARRWPRCSATERWEYSYEADYSELVSLTLRARFGLWGWGASPTPQVQFQVLTRTSSRSKGRQSLLVSKLTAVAEQQSGRIQNSVSYDCADLCRPSSCKVSAQPVECQGP